VAVGTQRHLAEAAPVGLAQRGRRHLNQIGQHVADDPGHAHPVGPAGLDAQHLTGDDGLAGQVGGVVVAPSGGVADDVPGSAGPMGRQQHHRALVVDPGEDDRQVTVLAGRMGLAGIEGCGHD
jgi:hypothetical protein